MTKFLPAILYGLIAVMVLAMVPGCDSRLEQAQQRAYANLRKAQLCEAYANGERDEAFEIVGKKRMFENADKFSEDYVMRHPLP